ncbi:hypothetical protein [Peribacillus sp. SCS-155]|uniref:hypothetical protein n=1 Tax=Peribacillus sedimenti TaxID=3115297 RepID=UPI003905B1A4
MAVSPASISSTWLRIDIGKVEMAEDGVYDVPALASATVELQWGEQVLETADTAFMGDILSKLPFKEKLRRNALGITMQNNRFSITIELFALIVVSPGWLILWIWIFADMEAKILATLNSLRLYCYRTVKSVVFDGTYLSFYV